MQIRKWLLHFGGNYLLSPSLGSYHEVFFNTAVREGDFVDLCLFTHPSLMVTAFVCILSHHTFRNLSPMYLCLPTCLPVCYLPIWLPVFLTTSLFLRLSLVLSNSYCTIWKKPVGDVLRILWGCSVGIPEARDLKQCGVWFYLNVIENNAEFCEQLCVLILELTGLCR